MLLTDNFTQNIDTQAADYWHGFCNTGIIHKQHNYKKYSFFICVSNNFVKIEYYLYINMTKGCLHERWIVLTPSPYKFWKQIYLKKKKTPHVKQISDLGTKIAGLKLHILVKGFWSDWLDRRKCNKNVLNKHRLGR